MTELLPAGMVPREALPLIRKYAMGTKGEFSPSALIRGIIEKSSDEWDKEQLEQFGIDFGFGAARTGIGAVLTGNLPGLFIGTLSGLLFGTDRQCSILLVNATPVPLTLKESKQISGEVAGVPSFPANPPRLNYVPAATDSALGTAMWGFRKSTILGIGFEGTYGWLDFSSDPDVLPDGFRLAWMVPQSGHTSCGVSFDTTAKGRPWFDKHCDDTRRMSDWAFEGGPGFDPLSVKDVSKWATTIEKALDGADRAAMCAHSTRNENTSLLVALVEAK